jgi:hypothetical protein
MMINVEQAIKILEGMPSDTAIWNWWGVSDMIEAAEHAKNIDDFVAALCELEQLESEQMLAQDDSDELAKLEAERLSALQKRVRAIIEATV